MIKFWLENNVQYSKIQYCIMLCLFEQTFFAVQNFKTNLLAVNNFNFFISHLRHFMSVNDIEFIIFNASTNNNYTRFCLKKSDVLFLINVVGTAYWRASSPVFFAKYN
jgi:hypothetical protein